VTDGGTPNNINTGYERSDGEARDRLVELLADERLAQLSPDDRAELESLVAADPSSEEIARRLDEAVGRLLVELDERDPAGGMPAAFRERLRTRGEALIGGAGRSSHPSDDAAPAVLEMKRPSSGGGGLAGWIAAAACLLLAAGVAFVAVREVGQRERLLAETRASAESRIAENQRLLAEARAELDLVSERYTLADRRRLELLEQLADATSRLDEAELTIARLEAPEDPAVLAANREKLLDLNGTIRVAWQPFDVPGLPETEQRNVEGDVVWNDDLQTGYLRFRGLAVNDPDTEQYQVWVIDERGMEQKVSGGVFNATRDGELIVPIEPGIDVGRVQVFAITVEEPGGIWVPDLKRRIVVAPRGEDSDG
jgi:hypothetical protein